MEAEEHGAWGASSMSVIWQQHAMLCSMFIGSSDELSQFELRKYTSFSNPKNHFKL
jgi:hypothetical protein